MIYIVFVSQEVYALTLVTPAAADGPEDSQSQVEPPLSVAHGVRPPALVDRLAQRLMGRNIGFINTNRDSSLYGCDGTMLCMPRSYTNEKRFLFFPQRLTFVTVSVFSHKITFYRDVPPTKPERSENSRKDYSNVSLQS